MFIYSCPCGSSARYLHREGYSVPRTSMDMDETEKLGDFADIRINYSEVCSFLMATRILVHSLARKCIGNGNLMRRSRPSFKLNYME